MSINSTIRTALTPIVPEVVPNVYTGSATEYITFNYNSLPDDYGDDDPQHERYLVQVHYVLPLQRNGLSTIKSIKQALTAAGFTYPAVFDATDKDGQHYVFECEIAEGV